jgi:hypothetical protein
MPSNDLYKYVLLLILFVTAFSLYSLSRRILSDKTYNQPAKKTVVFNAGTKVIVDVADTDAKRAEGLSKRERLAEMEGMLFIYPAPGIYYFWMKDMNFDLDFVWINNGTIVDITQNVSHNNRETLCFSKVAVNMILEVNAGFVKKNLIKVGSKVKIINN